MAKTFKIIFVFKLFGAKIDGVSDYLRCLTQSLEKKDVQVEILTGNEPGFLNKIKESGADAVNLHYVPQAYSRLGVTFKFTWALFVSRFVFHKKGIITFHEVYEHVYLHRPFRWPFALLQRIQLFLFLIISNQIIFSTPVFLPRIENVFPFWKHKIHCLPVFSNIPLVNIQEEDRLNLRSRWGINSEDMVLGVFSKTLHEALNLEMLFKISRNLINRGISARVFLIGAMKDSNLGYFRKLQVLADELGVKPIWTGELSFNEISKALQMIDLYMGLWPDGASPRSTTMMSALEHGLTVLTGKSPQMRLYPDFESHVLSVDPLNEKTVVQVILAHRAKIHKSNLEGPEVRQFYQRNFGPEKIAEKFKGFL